MSKRDEKSSVSPTKGERKVKSKSDGQRDLKVLHFSPRMKVLGKQLLETLNTDSKCVKMVQKYLPHLMKCNSQSQNEEVHGRFRHDLNNVVNGVQGFKGRGNLGEELNDNDFVGGRTIRFVVVAEPPQLVTAICMHVFMEPMKRY